jgi:hypothetical protein
MAILDASHPVDVAINSATLPEGVTASATTIVATPTMGVAPTQQEALPVVAAPAIAATPAREAPLAMVPPPGPPPPHLRREAGTRPDSRNNSSSKSAQKSLQWVRPPGTALCAPPDVFVLRQRLASKLAWWKDAGTCWQILRTIRHGVHLEFAHKPRPFQTRHIPVPDRWRPWLHQELDRAIAAGAYEAATCTDFVAPAFIIKQRNKLRLVINFQQINKLCIDMSCRYEGLRNLCHLLQHNDWMLSLDLQDAYWHIPVAQDHRKYLTFCIDGRTLQCAALPFGWKGSPLTFTKVMRAFVKYLRSRGIRCLPYLDDLAFFISGSRSRALRP